METTLTAILLRAPNKELLLDARKACGDSLPLFITLPCGNGFSAATVDDIPIESVPCPCGDPTHWLVKVEIDPSLDRTGQ